MPGIVTIIYDYLSELLDNRGTTTTINPLMKNKYKIFLTVAIFFSFISICFAASPREISKEITICIPTYNSAKTLKDCVESVSKFGRYQFLIYDNGSTDETRAIINELMKEHDIKTKLIPHQFPKVHMLRSYNSGVMRGELVKDVKTPYIFFLDSDIILSEPIEPLLKALNNKIGMAGYTYSQCPHLQMGATMIETKIAKNINWIRRDTCNCLNARDYLMTRNLGEKFFENAKIIHKKSR